MRNECVANNKTILKLQRRFKSDVYNIFPEKVNKIALRANDNNRIQKLDGVATCPYDYECCI